MEDSNKPRANDPRGRRFRILSQRRGGKEKGGGEGVPSSNARKDDKISEPFVDLRGKRFRLRRLSTEGEEREKRGEIFLPPIAEMIDEERCIRGGTASGRVG